MDIKEEQENVSDHFAWLLKANRQMGVEGGPKSS